MTSLEHGALWAIGSLSLLLLATIRFNIPRRGDRAGRSGLHRLSAGLLRCAQQALGRGGYAGRRPGAGDAMTGQSGPRTGPRRNWCTLEHVGMQSAGFRQEHVTAHL